MNDLGNTLTTGTLEWTIEWEFLVGALPFLNSGVVDRGSAKGCEVILLASLDNTAHNVFWTPPSNGRISNIRLTLWNAEVLQNDEFIYFGKGVFTDAVVDSDAIEGLTDGLYLKGGITTDVSDEDIVNILTSYTKDIEFIKKGELMHLYTSKDDATHMQVLVEFDFIPDFDKNVDLIFGGFIDDLATGLHMKVYQIPFDMYIEKINFDFRMDDSTVNMDIRILGLKDMPEVLSLAEPISGSILGASGVMAQSSGVLPSNILETYSVSTGQLQDTEDDIEVFDYYPAGAFIIVAVDVESASSVENIDFTTHIEGKSRVKSSYFGYNYLLGGHVYQEMNN